MREMTIKNIVIGSGAAGLSAAYRLWNLGEHDTAIVTENMNAGTSRNTGSDKQTYYKLSLSGPDPDSVRNMAEDLFACGAVDGDMALCEAAVSVRGFFNLVELGVPFPCDEYSQYMGYKTDHDRGRRATSAGPYTSRMMTEALERAVRSTGVRILDGHQAIRLLCREGKIRGVLCFDRRNSPPERECAPAEPEGAPRRNSPSERECDREYVILWAENVILATGGPAGMYRDSVYPQSQLGASGMAFAVGVSGKNLTEWQFGMASLAPRWNVSGTYMQVLPRFISTDRDGGGCREFLREYWTDEGEMLSMIFLKGYQWPFDTAKIFTGSSLIDILVYRETILRGRRVFLDFTQNPGGKEIPFGKLSEEAYLYLDRAGALFGTPIERLRQMNEPAILFYKDHGVDLAAEPLEIAICAQHNNGGLATNADWETEIRGLFAVGEVNGSHGITRPGGSALNAGQVGAVRAAEAIRFRNLAQETRNTQETRNAQETRDTQETEPPSKESPRKDSRESAEADIREELRGEALYFAGMAERAAGERSAAEVWKELAAQMSAAGGMVRDRERIREELLRTEEYLEQFEAKVRRPQNREKALFYRLYDMLIARKVYLAAMEDYTVKGPGSRGSALYTDPEGELPEALPEIFRCRKAGDAGRDMVQEVRILTPRAGVCPCGAGRRLALQLTPRGTAAPGGTAAREARLLTPRGTAARGTAADWETAVTWRPVREIPEPDDFFENQWKAFRERRGI